MNQRDTNPNHRLFEEREHARREGAMRAAATARASSSPPPSGSATPQRVPRGREEIEATARAPGGREEKGESALAREAHAIDRGIQQGASPETRREFAKGAREQGMTPPGGHPGVSAVITAVEDLDFPLTTDELIEKRGEMRVEVAHNVKPPLKDVLCQVGEGRIESLQHLKEILHKNWHAISAHEVDRGVARRTRGR